MTRDTKTRDRSSGREPGAVEHLDRLSTIVDEAFGPQPVMPAEELLTFLERKLFENRAEFIALREAYADLERRSLAALEQMTVDAATAITGAGAKPIVGATEMREAAIVFALVAVAREPALRYTETLQLVIDTANRCRPAAAPVLTRESFPEAPPPGVKT